MKPIDFIAPLFGLVWGGVTYFLLKQNKSKLELWPRIVGLGLGLYAILALMTASIMNEPISEFFHYTIENLFWSVALGIIGYFSGRAYARHWENKK
jgi:hypothetical protein